MADAVSDSIVVAADPDTIMDIISDFETYPRWQDRILQAEILETDDDGWGTLVRFVVDAKLFQATLVLAYTYEPDAMRWVLTSGEGVRRNDGAYLLDDQGDGTTRVTYELIVEPAVPFPGLLKRQAARTIVDSALRGLKERAEADVAG